MISVIDIKDLEKKDEPVKKAQTFKFTAPKGSRNTAEIKPIKASIQDLPEELTGNIKNLVIKASSYTAGNKKAEFENKLKESKYLNKYIDKYLMLDNVAMLNDHVKAIAIYGFIYCDTMLK
jgi:hypothetical protein